MPDKQQPSTEEALSSQARELEARLELTNAHFDKLANAMIDRNRNNKKAAPPPNIPKANPSPVQSPSRIAVCTECYTHRRRCDAGDPCQQCRERGQRCVRAKCQHWKRGTCTRIGCTRWHEENGDYFAVENTGRILRRPSRKVRKPRVNMRNPRNHIKSEEK